MKKKGLLALGLVTALMLSGCGENKGGASEEKADGKDTTSQQVESEDSSDEVTETVVSAVTYDSSELFSDRDYETDYDESKSAVINLNGTTASCSSDAVSIDGGNITIKDEGTYILRGTLSDGMIFVNAGEDDKTQLVLDGADITSSEGAPIYVYEADKVFVTLAKGSENTLANGGTFTPIDDNNIDGVIFSKSDLTLNGEGSLNITSPVGHGVVAKDELTITGGLYNISCASSGFRANDNICIDGGAYTIASGKDGIHAEHSEDTSLGFVYIANGSFSITSEGDGISSTGYMEINGGSFDILAGGGSVNGEEHSSGGWGDMPGGGMFPGGGPGGGPRSMDDAGEEQATTADVSTSMKGMKSDGILYINGGSFNINSADDGVHSNASIYVTDGAFAVATGDDGFHGEEVLDISGGTIRITESYEGLEALDVTISGGTIDIVASDDGINAAGGTDSSGFGGRDEEFGGFGGPGMGPGGMGPGGMSSGAGGSVTISAGTINIQASGDGIDSNGTLEITGGITTVCGPTNGDTAVLDYETSGTIEGGTFIGTGSTMMAMGLESDGQGVLPISVGQQEAGSTIVVTDSQGKEVVRLTPELTYEIFILSSPEIEKGATYTITIGELSGEVQAN